MLRHPLKLLRKKHCQPPALLLEFAAGSFILALSASMPSWSVQVHGQARVSEEGKWVKHDQLPPDSMQNHQIWLFGSLAVKTGSEGPNAPNSARLSRISLSSFKASSLVTGSIRFRSSLVSGWWQFHSSFVHSSFVQFHSVSLAIDSVIQSILFNIVQVHSSFVLFHSLSFKFRSVLFGFKFCSVRFKFCSSHTFSQLERLAVLAMFG